MARRSGGHTAFAELVSAASMLTASGPPLAVGAQSSTCSCFLVATLKADNTASDVKCTLSCRTTLASTPGLHSRLLQSLKPKTEGLIQQGYPLGTWYVPEVYKHYVEQVSKQ